MARRGLGLSKNLLQMKFMQRTKEKQERESSESEINVKSLDVHNKESSKMDGHVFLVESSFEVIENLRFGRMSYKGMNQEIEKLINGVKDDEAEDGEIEEDEDVDIPKQEMSHRYSKFRGTKRSNEDSPAPWKKKQRNHYYR